MPAALSVGNLMLQIVHADSAAVIVLFKLIGLIAADDIAADARFGVLVDLHRIVIAAQEHAAQVRDAEGGSAVAGGKEGLLFLPRFIVHGIAARRLPQIGVERPAVLRTVRLDESDRRRVEIPRQGAESRRQPSGDGTDLPDGQHGIGIGAVLDIGGGGELHQPVAGCGGEQLEQLFRRYDQLVAEPFGNFGGCGDPGDAATVSVA